MLGCLFIQIPSFQVKRNAASFFQPRIKIIAKQYIHLHQILSRSRADTADKLSKAVTLPSVETLFAVLAGSKSFVALTLIRTTSVLATAIVADVRVDGALVHILAVVSATDLVKRSLRLIFASAHL